MSLVQAIEQRRRRRLEECDKLRGKLEQRPLEDRHLWDDVVRWPFEQLRDELQSGHISAVEVLRAFQWHSILANDKTNCVTMFISEAETWAKQLDKIDYAVEAKPPLFGIPVSVKENFEIAGCDHTMGFAQYLNEPAAADSDIVKILRHCGAVPFAQTNLPQGMQGYFCANPIYGTTTHPLDAARTPGGSSGGEGALVSMLGSPLGFGSDAAGSVRIPAAFCAIAGFKPTSTRFWQNGIRVPLGGLRGGSTTWGPMARRVDTIFSVMSIVAQSGLSSALDPYVPKTSFDEEIYKSDRPLTIGYFERLDWFNDEAEPFFPVMRVVREARHALQAKGHILVPFTPPAILDVMRCTLGSCTPDPKALSQLVKRDIAEPLMAGRYFAFQLPAWLNRLIAWLAAFASPKLGWLASATPESSSDLRRGFETIDNYRLSFVGAWKQARLDALICPAFGTPPLSHERSSKLFDPMIYTMLFNSLDTPAGVVPAGRVTAEDERQMADLKESLTTKGMKQEACKGSRGLPLAVQCVALPNQDELCLRLMREVERVDPG